MPFIRIGAGEGLKGPPQYIDLLSHLPPDLRQRIRCFSFNRWGGVSSGPFESLNIGEAVGDIQENVTVNREIIKNFSKIHHILWVTQVHGADILHAETRHLSLLEETGTGSKVDGIISREPGLGLVIKHADCQSVVMFDPVNRVVANIHCGWRGSVKGILSKAVSEFVGIYGSRPRDIWAGVSPSLGPCCGEFRDWRTSLPEWMHAFQVRPDHFDFWAVTIQQLLEAGLPRNQIFCPRICTVCDSNYFSYRREGTTGRLATLIAISD